MIHPETELVVIAASIGRGVRASALLPRGTVVWIRDRFDAVLSPQQVAELPRPYRQTVQRWGYRDSGGRWILCADHARFVNHSCAPNLRSLGEDAQIAVRDIAPGEEITCDYAECNYHVAECHCGEAVCRGAIDPADLSRYIDAWDAEIGAALDNAAQLPQPLLPFVREPMRMEAWLSGLVAPPSVAALQLRDRLRSWG